MWLYSCKTQSHIPMGEKSFTGSKQRGRSLLLEAVLPGDRVCGRTDGQRWQDPSEVAGPTARTSAGHPPRGLVMEGEDWGLGRGLRWALRSPFCPCNVMLVRGCSTGPVIWVSLNFCGIYSLQPVSAVCFLHLSLFLSHLQTLTVCSGLNRSVVCGWTGFGSRWLCLVRAGPLRLDVGNGVDPWNAHLLCPLHRWAKVLVVRN